MPPQPKNPARYMPVTMSTRTVVSGGYYEKNRVYPVMTKEVEDVDLQRYTFCKEFQRADRLAAIGRGGSPKQDIGRGKPLPMGHREEGKHLLASL